MKKIIAQYQKPSYGFDILLFCILSFVDISLFILGICNQLVSLIWITIFIMVLMIFIFIAKIMHISKNKNIDNTLIYYENNTFYFPTLMLEVAKQDISRVVYELQRYVFIYVPVGKSTMVAPVKNAVGKLHITYFFDGVEYYIKLKKVIAPDVVEKTIKKLCNQ